MSQQGALLSLVAYSAENANIPQNFAHDYKTYGPEQLTSTITIGRNADTFIPEYIKFGFTQSNQINPDELKTQLSKLTVQMNIGGADIVRFPLALLVHLVEPEIIDSYIYINLQFDKIFGSINLVGLTYHDVVFKVVNNNPTIPIGLLTTWELVGTLTYFEQETRQSLVQTPYDDFVHHIYHMDVNANNSDLSATASEFKFSLAFDSPHKGLFIKCSNANDIYEINLNLNGLDRFKLDKFLIKTKCKIVSNQLLWFPFNPTADFMSKNPNSFNGSINFSRIDNIKLEVKFNPNTPKSQISIFGLGSNRYRQLSGMGGLAYVHGSFTYELRDLLTNYSVLPTPSSQFTYQSHTGQVTKVIFTPVGFKIITDQNYMFCPISFGDIPIGTQYSNCFACKNNYCVDMLTKWLDKKLPNERACPMCKTKWTNWNAYINDVEPASNLNEPLTDLALVQTTNQELVV